MIEIRADGCLVRVAGVVGYQHENYRAQIRFPLDDVLDIVTENPGGSYAVVYKRMFDEQFFTSTDYELDGAYLIWNVSSHVVAVRGELEVQIVYSTDQQIAATQIYHFKVARGLMEDEEGQGENLSDLIEQALLAAGTVDQAIYDAQQTLDEKVTAAQAAQTAAEAAQTAAERAQHTAENAKTSAAQSANAAYNFAADANTAKRDATNAKDAAVQAKGAAETAKTAAETAQAAADADALKAEGYAVGTQNGTPAAEGQPYYQDNAKYYKEQAAAAKTAAEAARDTAQQTVAGIEAAGTAQVQRVAAEGATQVGNVQTKGQQVLESIPADYSELSGDVVDLKSTIVYAGENLNITFSEESQNKIINASGNIVSSTGFHYTNLLPVFLGHISVTYSNSTGQITLRVHGYDESGNWIRQLWSKGIGNVTETVEIEITNEIKYIRMNCPMSGNFTVQISNVTSIKDAIERTDETLQKLDADIIYIENIEPGAITDELGFVLGKAWSGNIGATASLSNTANRLANTTPVKLPKGRYLISCNTGYRLSYRTLDASNIVLSDSGWITTDTEFNADGIAYYAFTGGKVGDTSITKADFLENVFVKYYYALVEGFYKIDENIKNIESIEPKRIQELIFTRGKAWDGAVGSTATITSLYSYRFANLTPILLSENDYAIKVNSGYRISYRTLDATNKILSDSGWLTTDTEFSADGTVYYAFTGGKIDGSSVTDAEFYENVIVGYATNLYKETNNQTKAQITFNSNVKAVNHRGFNVIAPENTIPAFILSRKNGFKYVETDVRFTQDGIPVLLHDETINRTARNADGTTISETTYISSITYETALTYDFGIWKNPVYAGTKIPTLAQFMKLCRDIGLTPRVELNVLTVENAITMFNVIDAYGMARKVEYNCNNIAVAQKFLELEPTATIVYGMNSYNEGTVDAVGALKTPNNKIIINMYYTGVTDELIEKCKLYDIELEVWTVNTESTILGLNPYVSGVTSDETNAAIVLYNQYIK